MRQSLELDPALTHRRERAPVEREARGRRLERDGRARYPRPHVPERERHADVRVLNRTTVARKPRPDFVRRGVEEQRHEPRVPQQTLDGRAEWAERESVSGGERRRRGSVFGARAEVASAEDHGAEAAHVFGIKRGASGEPHFDVCARPGVYAPKARR